MNRSMHALNLSLVLIGNSLQRIAAGASGVLVGLYLAQLANRGSAIGAGLAGVLGAVSFGAELVTATPMGIASDAIAPRGLMTVGSVLGAGATQLFGMTGLVSIFFISRGLEGIGAAAVAPPLLAHLTQVGKFLPSAGSTSEAEQIPESEPTDFVHPGTTVTPSHSPPPLIQTQPPAWRCS